MAVMQRERLAALSDPTSRYFSNVCEILRTGAQAQQRAEQARTEVVLPFGVDLDERLRLERMFKWRLVVKDYGVRSTLTVNVAALSFLMGLRNLMAMGSDGEEVIFVDGDLPTMVAKGFTYGHVCRTSATARLAAGYQYEEMQLKALAASSSSGLAVSAASVLDDMQQFGCNRVCRSAAECTRRADVVLFNHIMTPVSLAQAVSTARAHRAVTVRGVCLFQVEMLTVDEGDLVAFPGRFVIDRSDDTISFFPTADSTKGFSHPYSSLMSFFLNHEYVDKQGRWLVEKHLSGDGVFHYILRQEDHACEFSEILSTNYYREDLTKWVELSYPTFFDESTGMRLARPKRSVVRILETAYEKTMAMMLCIDVKRLTQEEMITALRNHNNTVICGGDTVRRPLRVWADVVSKAAVPMLAMCKVRREAAAYELRASLDVLKKRFSVSSLSTASLLWSCLSSRVQALTGVAQGLCDDRRVADLCDLHFDGKDMSVWAKPLDEFLTVERWSGVVAGDGYGRVEPWLPKPPGRAGRSLALLGRAMAAVATALSSSTESGDVVMDDLGCFGGDDDVAGASHALNEVEVEQEKKNVETEGRRRELLDKLCAEQDAAVIGPPPRYVTCFEGLSRTDVMSLKPLDTDPVVVGQDSYDEFFPFVSVDDAEVKPVLAAEADFSKAVDFVGEINDAKREIPGPRRMRRSRLRTGAAGPVPRSQAGLMSALFKRNANVPSTRGHVDLSKEPTRVVERIIASCYVDGWEEKLNNELENGLWIPNYDDIQEYIPKVPSHRMDEILKEFFSVADENLSRWLIMVKGLGKPPNDAAAADKVHLPQTIMYSDQKGMNAKYSAMQTRFYHVVRSLLRPNVMFNNRNAPAEHENWFNACQPLRDGVDNVYRYEGDIHCYDRSQEHMQQTLEFAFYRRHGLDQATLYKWSELHGVKKATSMMLGVVCYIMMQGVSGNWKTLFRNGLVCWGAVITSLSLTKSDIVTLDVVGDDFLVETNRPVPVGYVVEDFALRFNFSAKFFGVDCMYMCSKYWIRVDGWWYFVQDPVRKFESMSRAVVASNATDEIMSEKWVSLRDDLRHYDNAFVMDALGQAVAKRSCKDKAPVGMIRALATWANDKDAFFKAYGPEEYVG